MTWFTLATLSLGVTGFTLFGWTWGVRDAEAEPDVPFDPWMSLVWGGVWMAVTLIEMGRST